MKKLFLVLIILISMCVPCYANDQQAVDSFKALTNEIVAEINTSYNNRDTIVRYIPTTDWDRKHDLIFDCWVKNGRDDLEYDINVEKTNSLIKPYVGYIYMSCHYLLYADENGKKNFKTKEEAEKATIPTHSKSYLYKYIYHYDGNTWKFSREQFEFSEYGSTYWKDTEKQFAPQRRFIITK